MLIDEKFSDLWTPASLCCSAITIAAVVSNNWLRKEFCRKEKLFVIFTT
jgi:hypothetical protein